jgi:hypothetical protein
MKNLIESIIDILEDYFDDYDEIAMQDKFIKIAVRINEIAYLKKTKTMANEPTMPGDFFETKIRECEEIGRYETCINPHEIYYRGCTDKCKYYAKPKIPKEICQGCRKRDELIKMQDELIAHRRVIPGTSITLLDVELKSKWVQKDIKLESEIEQLKNQLWQQENS